MDMLDYRQIRHCGPIQEALRELHRRAMDRAGQRQYFDNTTPVTGRRVFCEVARSSAADVELALDAAHTAKAAWGRTSTTERANILNKIADRIEANLPMLAAAETWDNGKPIRETMAADLPLDGRPFSLLRGMHPRRRKAASAKSTTKPSLYHYREPIGVVGPIIPWNFPILMATWKLAPALAAGNCVVLKPAEQTPVSILMLVELIADLLPPGVLNVVNGFGLEAGKPLASSNRIGKIAFTGETTTGRLISQYAQSEPDSGNARAWRQVAQRLFRRCDGEGRRLLRQGARRFRDVRAEPRRSLHLPFPGSGARVDL